MPSVAASLLFFREYSFLATPIKRSVMNWKANVKKALPYVLSVVFFAVVSYLYFAPEIFEGKILFQHDTQQGIAIGQEAKAFKEATGETTRWTNTTFSGMPTFQISPSYANYPIIRHIEHAYSLWMTSPASLVFIMLVGFFIFMLSMGCKWHYAVLGAIAYAFSSYFFIIIQAGHIWKFVTLAYIPPTLAGIVWAYRGRYLLGGGVAALFAMLQIASNHIQMSYYFLFVIVAMVVAYAVELIREKKTAQFLKASGVLVVAAALAIGANLPSLYHTQKYSKETMRGGHSELTATTGGAAAEFQSGLSKDYITQWSYGKMETVSLLIPNIKGGASGMLSSHEKAVEAASSSVRPYLSQVNSYWGDQPGTSGPVYVGAIICMLFVMGCITIKSPMKWALIAATILSILLSWGKNFMPLTDWFIDYFPMYNKFRTVSSILVVAEFCIPVLAIMALKQFFESPDKKQLKAMFVATGITAGIALLAYLAPGLFGSFTSCYENDMIAQNAQLRPLFDGIAEARQAVFSADALRTLLYIAAAALVMYLVGTGRFKKQWALLLLGVLLIADMGTVNKRYLNGDSFVENRRKSDPFPMTQVDKYILQDPDPNYRVFNLAAGDPFSDARTSYYHKSVGGYHAAKLARYQDLINRQLSRMSEPVLNMLNTKYFIVPLQDGNVTVQQNPDAMGNAWFVDEVQWVDNADAEMAALDTFDPARTAVVDRRFAELIDDTAVAAAEGDTIHLTSYRPNELRYISHTANDRIAVFSEIYFPWGWHVTIDGAPVKEARANYVLRALNIPAGTHEIVFRFEPTSIATTEHIAFASMAGILLMLLAAIFVRCRLKD